jgi:hypothetical protein
MANMEVNFILEKEEEKAKELMIDDLASEFVDYLSETFEDEADEELVNNWLNERYKTFVLALGDESDKVIQDFKTNIAYL